MENLIIVLKGMEIAWFITRFMPIQEIISRLPDKYFYYIKMALTCSKCVGFWSTLILFQNIWLSILTSFLMMLYEKTIGEWEHSVKL